MTKKLPLPSSSSNAQIRIVLAARGSGRVMWSIARVLVFRDAGDDAVLFGLYLDVPAELANPRDGAGKIGLRQ